MYRSAAVAAVAFGAFGAHGLAERLTAERLAALRGGSGTAASAPRPPG